MRLAATTLALHYFTVILERKCCRQFCFGPICYDPACYWGEFHECDLALTELFEGFPEEFYDGYRAVMPLDVGYILDRKDIYNLYHLLNHRNLAVSI